ncbi:MAG: hypothetical protein ACLQQ4_07765 [Bacteroidia bacterium]
MKKSVNLLKKSMAKKENNSCNSWLKNKKSGFQNGNFQGKYNYMKTTYITLLEFLKRKLAALFGSFGQNKFCMLNEKTLQHFE